MLDRFQIVHPIKTDAGAGVFLVRDRLDPEAEKTLTLTPWNLSRRRDRLSFEAFLDKRSSLTHLALPPIRGIGFRGRKVGLITDAVNAEAALTSSQDAVEKAAWIGLQAADLLLYLHRRELHWGPILPSQLHLDSKGHLVAQLPPPRLSHAPLSDSAIRYCAPEALQGAGWNRSCDLYSLGMLLYRLFAGLPPYFEDLAQGLKEKQLLAYPTPIRELRPDLPWAAAQLVEALIQKDPEMRPSSPSHAVAVLESLTEKRPRGCQEPELAFVGREAELSRFREIVERFSAQPKSGLALIEGVAGIGRSRLLERFSTILKLHRLDVREVGCPPDAGPEGWDLKEFPSALVIADLHLAGAAGWQRIADLLSGERPILVVGDSRIEECSQARRRVLEMLSRQDRVEVFRLEPIRGDHIRRLLQPLSEPERPTLLPSLLKQCAGNPFYLSETLRDMVRKGELKYSRDGWKCILAGERDDDAPSSVAEHALVRISRLARRPQELVETLSIIDRPGPVELAAAALGWGVEEIEHEARRLEGLQLARLGGTLSDSMISLTYPWLSRAIRASISAQRRRFLHRRIALCLEELLTPGSPAWMLEAVVLHSRCGGDEEKAQKFLRRAVDALRKESSASAAADLLEEAAGRDWDTDSQLILLLYQSGQILKCLKRCRRTLDSASVRAHPQRRAFVLSMLGRLHLLRGDAETASRVLQSAARILPPEADLSLDNEVQGELLGCLSYCGDSRRAAELAQRLSRESHRRAQDPSYEKICYAFFLYCQYLADRPSESIDWIVRSIRSALDLGRRGRASGRMINLSLVHLELGRFQSADRLLEYVAQCPEASANAEISVFLQFAQSLLRQRRGLLVQAEEGMSKLLRRNRRTNRNRNIEAGLCIELARNHAQRLQPEAALDYLQQCRPLLHRDSMFDSSLNAALTECWTRSLLGDYREALETLDQFDWTQTPRRRSEYRILKGRVLLESERLCEAEQVLSEAGSDCDRDNRLLRIQAAIALADLRLRKGDWEGAGCQARAAGRMASILDCPALAAESLSLLALSCLQQGKPPRARAYGLRALQAACRTENPALQAQVESVLGRIRLDLGETAAAQRSLFKALQVFKERLLELTPDRRRRFEGRFMAPIERNLRRIFPTDSSHSARYLTWLRRLTRLRTEPLDPRRLGEALLESTADCLATSGRFFWRGRHDGPFRLAASRGSCLRSGRHLLPSASPTPESSGGEILSCNDGITTELALRLRSEAGIIGQLYLECPRGIVRETELEFLSLLAGLASSCAAPVSAAERNGSGGQSNSGMEEWGIIGRHAAMQELFERIRRFAPTSAAVLIEGESGTGKELVAKAVHRLSRRKGGPLVAVNCSGLPESLIESELFGHARGSFTGAVQSKRGLFEAAQGGTLFLDEIATMPSNVQQSLLRALQEKRIRRVGDAIERPVDVRVISASNQPLGKLVESGAFRRDLFHRLNVCRLRVPSLRERRSDIGLLSLHFLDELNGAEGRSVSLASDALRALERYGFPGNVRELRNALESAFYLSRGNCISEAELGGRLQPAEAAQGEGESVPTILEDLISGRKDFWTSVRDPFLSRDLSRSEVRQVIALGLEACQGSYRRLLSHFRLPESDYKRFLGFLGNHRCKIDFRSYRPKPRTERASE